MTRRRLRVLVTRPLGEAELFAVALAMHGHEAVLAPMISIAPLADAAIDLAGAQALLFTSANGVRAFAQIRRERDLPAFCVGSATAEAARTAGFGTVEVAGGDVDALAALVRARLKPADGALVHAAGTVVAGDLAGALAADGFEVRRTPLYVAESAAELPDAAVAELRAGRIDAVTFFSPRTAEIFARSAHRAGLADEFGGVAAVALAQSAFDALHRENVPFGAEIAAARPEETALLDALDRLAEETAMPSDAPPPKFEIPGKTAQDSPKKAPPPREKPRAAVLVPVAIALIAALLGILGWAYWQSGMTGGGMMANRAIEQRLAALDRRVAQAEARPAAVPAVPVDLSAIEARLKTLESREVPAAAPAPDSAEIAALAARIAALEARPAADPAQAVAIAALTAENRRLADELARVQAEIGRLQGGIVDQVSDRAGARRAELRLATAQLRDALAAGRPFSAELGAVRDLAGDALAEVDATPLAAVAKDGVESRVSLARRFTALANAAVSLARTQSMPGILGEIAERAQGFLSIRRVGDVPGDSPAARVARAEARLAVDDLAGALGALEGVQGDAWAAGLLPWIETARRRLSAERAAAALAGLVPAGG
ncbi:MAG: uroporphyrinogen-III synthase [Rhodospirillales bacterium]|nr:uroporphyrinogen-III synthase [Rhodospirillales bacterium]